MGRKAPKPPPEDDSVVAARNRSLMDIAKIDEETNRRIKQLRSASRGVRAFRAVRSASAGPSVIGIGASGSGGMSAAPTDGGSGNYYNWGAGNALP